MDEHLKHAVDALSVGTVLATLGGYMPEIAAAFSIIWTSIRIYETKTVQGVVAKVQGVVAKVQGVVAKVQGVVAKVVKGKDIA